MTRPLVCLALMGITVLSGSVSAQEAWGTIKGKIIWGGDKLPPPGIIKLPAENPGSAGCIQANMGKLPPDETWVVNKKNKGIKNTYVWLVDPAKKPLPIHPDLKEIKVKQIEIDQPACHFIPHALALRQGQTLLVKNSAPFAHSFKYSGSVPQNGGSVTVPATGDVKVNLVADRLPIAIECAIHPWMRGWIRVFDHPYFAVTDENGAFTIKNAPAGNFRLMIWHGSAGWKGGAAGRNGDPVQIQAGRVVDLGSVPFPPPKE